MFESNSNFVKADSSCNTVNQADNSTKQSSGRPKKRVESETGGETGGGETGGGEEQLTEEEETSDAENNDPSFKPSPEKRPRHEGVGRGGGGDVTADGGGGGGGDDAGVRQIPAQVPVNILEITAGLAVMEKMSVRQHLMFLSGVLVACGVNIDDLELSLSTAQRVRESECGRLKDSTLENFTSELAEDDGVKLVAHFDGKTLKHDMGGKTGTAERMVTLVSGPLVPKPQPLAAVPMDNTTGYETAVCVEEVLTENNVASRVVAVVVDTCSVNFGPVEGAVYHLARLLDRQLLYLECKHHDEDLVPKAVKRVLIDRDSTSPTDYVVSTWQNNFATVQDEVRGDNFVFNTFNWDWVESHPQVKAAVVAARFWARQARRDQEFDKSDYSSLVDAILVYLGDVVPGYCLPRPATVSANNLY